MEGLLCSPVAGPIDFEHYFATGFRVASTSGVVNTFATPFACYTMHVQADTNLHNVAEQTKLFEQNLEHHERREVTT